MCKFLKVCMCIFVCVCLCVHMDTCVYMSVCRHIFVCIFTLVCICLYAGIYLLYLYKYVVSDRAKQLSPWGVHLYPLAKDGHIWDCS